MSIRDAIKIVQRVAKKYSVDEEAEAIEAEILPILEARMRRWIRRELVSVKFVQFSDLLHRPSNGTARRGVRLLKGRELALISS